MDAVKIERATIAGFDWGARTVNIMAALWPERCKATVSVSGYLIGSQEAGKIPLPPRPSSNGVPILSCHRARPCRLRQVQARLCEVIWQLASAEVEFP